MIRTVFLFYFFLICILNGVYPQSLSNQAISLNGFNQYIRIPAQVYHNEAGTIEMWMKRIEEGLGRNPLFGGIESQESQMPGMFMDRGDLFWEFGELEAQPTGKNLEEDRWYHVALSYEKKNDGYRVVVWLNGESVSKREGVSFSENWLQELHIGHFWGGPIDYFKGQLDEIRIWSKARSEDEIRLQMCQFADSTDQNLLMYLNFEEEEGTIAMDLTGQQIAESGS